jgi:SAM-dependent methyltransferase
MNIINNHCICDRKNITPPCINKGTINPSFSHGFFIEEKGIEYFQMDHSVPLIIADRIKKTQQVYYDVNTRKNNFSYKKKLNLDIKCHYCRYYNRHYCPGFWVEIIKPLSDAYGLADLRLKGLAGRILDVGGDYNITKMNLKSNTEYFINNLNSISDKKLSKNCIIGPIEDLKQHSEFFDVVFCRGSYNHFLSAKRAIKNIYYALKFKGILIMCDQISIAVISSNHSGHNYLVKMDYFKGCESKYGMYHKRDHDSFAALRLLLDNKFSLVDHMPCNEHSTSGWYIEAIKK